MHVSASWPPWICPAHGEPLVIRDGVLTCPRGDSFPLVDDVARFVETEGYAAAFGAQWNRYPLTQLDSHSGLPISEARARRCLGEQLWSALGSCLVLECGCGA